MATQVKFGPRADRRAAELIQRAGAILVDFGDNPIRTNHDKKSTQQLSSHKDSIAHQAAIGNATAAGLLNRRTRARRHSRQRCCKLSIDPQGMGATVFHTDIKHTLANLDPRRFNPRKL